LRHTNISGEQLVPLNNNALSRNELFNIKYFPHFQTRQINLIDKSGSVMLQREIQLAVSDYAV
jgi:hypothetical protein